MAKQTIEINVPEGYEVAEGDQPRRPKAGEYFLSELTEVKECHIDFEFSIHIILKKKKPKYATLGFGGGGILNDGNVDCAKKYVEIQALEDALTIISRMETGTMLGMDIKTCEALKELIK